MIGDKLIIRKHHVNAARQILEMVLLSTISSKKKFILTIAGESGAGKTEIAYSLSRQLLEKGIKSLILQQDDYFVFPPKTNAKLRKHDIGHVGISEVQLPLIDQNLADILAGEKTIKKPLVIYDEDRITTETIKLKGISVIIVEGTYISLLKHVHCRIFINRTYFDTRESRQQRAREQQDEYLEKILQIEHKIISSHKEKSDIVISKDYTVRANG